MTKTTRRALMQGALGGLIAGAVVALWFLVVDVVAGAALETPARLASAFLEREYEGVTLGAVAVFTVMHFGVFTALGMVTGWFLEATDFNPGPLVGVVLGLGVMNSLHYSALLLAGLPDVTLLPTHHVVGANLTAGLVFMAYLGWVEEADRPFGLKLLEAPLLTRGLVTGLVGALAVALWFFVLDILAREPFFTPAALGSALLGSAGSGAEVRITPGIVVFYSVLHLAAFTVAGTVFVLVAEQIERTPWFWFLAAMSFIVLEAVFVPTLGLLGEWLMGVLAWWAVGIGNLLAVASMGWWVLRTHPELRRRLREEMETSPA